MESLYMHIYKKLKSDITTGIIPIGEKLHTDTELSKEFHVSSITIKKSMELLKNDGLISRKPKKGTFVIAKRPILKNQHIANSKITIGVIITGFNDYFGADLLSALLTYSESSATLIIRESHGDHEKEATIINELVTGGVEGLIILPASSEFISPTILDLISKNFPIVVIDRALSNLPICSVSSNNRQSAKNATEELFKQGHKSLGLLSMKSDLSTVSERTQGFIDAHLETNNPLNSQHIFQEIKSTLPISSNKTKLDISKIRSFISLNNEITGIITSEYKIALLLKDALAQLNLSIPNDLSVICFDHSKDYFYSTESFMFSHVKQNEFEMGKRAIEMILIKIENPKIIMKDMIPTTFINGKSVKSLI